MTLIALIRYLPSHGINQATHINTSEKQQNRFQSTGKLFQIGMRYSVFLEI
jgi:hypothetical protein